jgi:hypothetical protein
MILKILTFDEWNQRRKIALFEKYGQWHRYFCWLPKRIDVNRVVWFQWVLRKKNFSHWSCRTDYRLIEETKLIGDNNDPKLKTS